MHVLCSCLWILTYMVPHVEPCRLQEDWSIRTLALTYWLDCNDPLLCQVALVLNKNRHQLHPASSTASTVHKLTQTRTLWLVWACSAGRRCVAVSAFVGGLTLLACACDFGGFLL